MVKNIIILGPQGSGKGTQAKLLTEKFGHVLIGAGDSLREIAKEDSVLGRSVKETIDAGHLVDPELMSEVIRERIEKVPREKPVIIDGYPRSRKQQEHMKKFWPGLGRGDFTVLFIELPEEEATKRMSGRKAMEQREDDKPEAIRRRLQYFNAETMPVVREMENDGKVVRIDGAPSIEKVHDEILSKLKLK